MADEESFLIIARYQAVFESLTHGAKETFQDVEDVLHEYLLGFGFENVPKTRFYTHSDIFTEDGKVAKIQNWDCVLVLVTENDELKTQLDTFLGFIPGKNTVYH